jgi:hypothetical protein
MYYPMNDDGSRPRQIILDILEESEYMLSEANDARRSGKITKKDAI